MEINYSVKHKTVVENRVYFSLILRSLLFIITGLVITGLFALQGFEQPLKAAEKWWPFQAIIANIITFFILKFFLNKEGLTYKSLFSSPSIGFRKKIQEFFLLLVCGIIGGAVPLYVFSYFILGSFIPPATHFQELPIIFATIALILFPLSNALVELPTYLGYSLPRLSKLTGKVKYSLLLVALGLSLQHMFLPLVLEPDYMLWRLLSFIPLALIVGAIFTKTRRLLPIVIVHFLMDLQLVVQMFITSISS